MIDLGTLFINIAVDKDEAEKKLNSVAGTTQKAEGKINNSMSNIGKAVLGAFSVAAVTNFTKNLIEASADIKATEAQFEQVFKDDMGTAIDTINKQADELGIHTDRLTESWNKFGGQVKGAGMDGEQSLEATEKATRLAADAAAFFDSSLEDASGSIASFMKGNFEAGDAIGVFTSAKQMDVKSNETYGKSWADLTEAERQYLLLDTVEKTYELNGAIGQATREADGYENVMGNLKATFSRLYATIGEPVLEAFLKIVQIAVGYIEDFQAKIQDGTISFDGFKDAIIRVYGWLKEQLTPILQELWKIFKNYLLPILQMIFDWVSANIPTIKKIIEVAFGIVGDVVKSVGKAFELILPILTTLYNWIEPYFPVIQEIVETTFGAIGKAVEIVTDIFWGVVDAIKAAIEWLQSWNDTEADDKEVGSGNNRPYRSSNASGLDYVPFDNYVANLHEGERVLTKQEAEQYKNNTSNISITGNSFVIREEADIQKISRELQRQISMKQRGTVMA